MGKLLQLPKRRKLKFDLNTNTVVCGDCIDWLKEIPSNSVQMAYLDPPFFSNRTYEIIWGNGYERRSFEDRWKGGVKSYISWMEERIGEIPRILKPNGSLFLHCDWRASHRLRVMLDGVFDDKNFVNEIIWCYGSGGVSERHFSKKHDTIFWYAKSKNYIFNCDAVREPYKEKCKVEHKIVNGKKYSRRNKLGRIPFDWFEIPIITNTAKERIGYKTQKPEALLERIIKCSTNKGDICLDAFGGGGTTAAVAAKLGRKFITGDVSPVAIRVISKRLNDLDNRPAFNVINVPQTKDEWLAMNPHEFADRICAFMGWKSNPRRTGDGGIDGWAVNDMPIQIKNHRKKIGRPDLQKFVGSLGRFEKGLFVAWDFASNAWEYSVQIKDDYGKEVELIKVEDILGDILIDSDKKMEIEKLLAERISS